MPHFLAVALVRQNMLIIPEASTVQQVMPVAFQVTLSADEMIVSTVTFDLPEKKAVTCHHESIERWPNPFLPENISHNAAHFRRHCREAARVKFRRESFHRRGQTPDVAVITQHQRLAIER